ncbi:Melanin-concentrating hormone receptor 2 [Aphelenchoides bicaudatus]|nr:Melanin-concentrating hormone receptor 2 [Aphelenchoides bicaudatus]
MDIALKLFLPQMDVEMPTVQFVNYGETIADIAQTEKTSASLTATTSILLAVLLIVSFVTNLLLVATILSSCKLRSCLLYLIICELAVLNVLDTIFVMFLSLMYVANGSWIFGDGVCRLNTWAQEFISLYSFFLITLMAMERALGLTDNGRFLVTPKYALAFSVIFGLVAFCFATPAFMSTFSVQAYPYRYLCDIGGQAPIAYSIVQMVAFGGCIFVNTICFGALIRYNNIDRSLPARPQDYGAFIMESRALQDYMIHGRLVLFICLGFIIVEGPYIILNLFVQIKNSGELLRGDPEFNAAQDIDTLITWLKFFFPLIFAILVYTNCSDIWCKLVNLICCRRSNGIWSSQKGNNQCPDHRRYPANDNVLTLVATTEGDLQIRLPGGQQLIHPPTAHCQYYEEESETRQQEPISREEEVPSEMKTQKINSPKVLKIPKSFTANRKRSKIPRTTKPSNTNQPSDRTFRVAKKQANRPKVQFPST